MNPYTITHETGMWIIWHDGKPVRSFHTETLAKVYADAWNQNRQPTRTELANALNSLWIKPYR
jgi:hypothetical protein